MEELVSIIIPVYNVENYLDKCLDSVINQTYKNLEIVIVNDGSTDNSENIILDYLKKDNRIVYIKKKNGGLSSARNSGLDKCKGKYVSFVDSDDTLDTKFIKRMVACIEKDHTQIAICNMRYIFPDNTIKKRTPQIKKREIVTNIQAIKDILVGEKFKFHAQNKIYLTQLFNDPTNIVRFPVGRIYEDMFTTYKVIFKANQISYINETLYNYLQNREGSILNTRFNESRFDAFIAIDEINKFLKSENLKLDQEMNNFMVDNVISLVNYIYPIYFEMSRYEKVTYMKRIKKFIKLNGLNSYRESRNKIKYFRMFLIYNIMPLYVIIMKTVKSSLFKKVNIKEK